MDSDLDFHLPLSSSRLDMTMMMLNGGGGGGSAHGGYYDSCGDIMDDSVSQISAMDSASQTGAVGGSMVDGYGRDARHQAHREQVMPR